MLGTLFGVVSTLGNHKNLSYRIKPVKVYGTLDGHEPLMVYISKGKEHELYLRRRPDAVSGKSNANGLNSSDDRTNVNNLIK